MKHKYLLSAIAIVLCVAGSLVAQDNPGTLAVLEFQKPKNGMVLQYEAGRKQKAAWHKQQNDGQPLMVWEILSGENTGTYVVGRFGQHWTDLDKPSVPDEADLAEYQKVIGNYVDSVTTSYYEYMPKVSNPPSDTMAAKFSEVITFHVRYSKISQFRSALSRIHDAAEKTKWGVNYEFFALANGGTTGTFVLVIPHNNWADFGDNPNVKPFRDMIKEAYGQEGADSIMGELDSAVEKETSEISKFRTDLSYLPGK